jgi:hypothetical protein
MYLKNMVQTIQVMGSRKSRSYKTRSALKRPGFIFMILNCVAINILKALGTRKSKNAANDLRRSINIL